MTRILVIGYAPEAVDFSDPGIPPGMNAAKVAQGLQTDQQSMRARGWHPSFLPILPDNSLVQAIERHLAANTYDCIVIGAGVRMAANHVAEFEKAVAAVRRAAPQTPLAFNSSPDSSGEAAARWIQPAAA